MNTLDWLLLALVALAAVAAIRHWRIMVRLGCAGVCQHGTVGWPNMES